MFKIRIEENGSVSVIDAIGANGFVNNALQAAVEHWKSTPAMDAAGPRCVRTEIPFTVNRR